MLAISSRYTTVRGLGVLVLAGACGNCGKAATLATSSPHAELDGLLAPEALARALRAADGGRFAATTTFRVARKETPGAGNGNAGEPASISTTTALVLGRSGNFHLTENNDRDGGRDVVLHGKELAVAVRPGRSIKRPAQEPEATRFLQEAMGGPGALWEVARRQARVDKSPVSGGGVAYKLSLLGQPLTLEPRKTAPGPLSAWRQESKIEKLDGEILLRQGTALPHAARIDVRWSHTRQGVTYEGNAHVEARLDQIGSAPEIEAPQASEVVPRQRTVLEERALLGRVAGSVAPAARKP